MPRSEANPEPRGLSYGQGIANEQMRLAGALARPAQVTSARTAPQAARQADFAEADILEAILAPTTRPDEPVTTGLDRFQGEQIAGLEYWLPLLEELSSSPDASPFVRELAARARLTSGRD